MSQKSDNFVEAATRKAVLAEDERLRNLTRDQILNLSPQLRLRWFHLLQLNHAELERISVDLLELLEADNDVRIISIIGMTGIGKTTLAERLVGRIGQRLGAAAGSGDVPVIYVRAPANGDKSFSWRVLYRRILEGGGEQLVERKRATVLSNGVQRLSIAGRTTLAELREFIETMVDHRRVRLLVIDEALHFLRHGDYSATMDTLKSLADMHDLKLLLIGTYQIADLMTENDQVMRRGQIVHYRRYASGKWSYPSRPENLTHEEAKLSDAEIEFGRQLAKLQARWPCAQTPNLIAIADHLMNASLGSIGLLKATLLRMASLQMSCHGERLTPSMLTKGPMSKKALARIDDETKRGEEKLKDACYGDALAGGKQELDQLLAKFMEAQHA